MRKSSKSTATADNDEQEPPAERTPDPDQDGRADDEESLAVAETDRELDVPEDADTELDVAEEADTELDVTDESDDEPLATRADDLGETDPITRNEELEAELARIAERLVDTHDGPTNDPADEPETEEEPDADPPAKRTPKPQWEIPEPEVVPLTPEEIRAAILAEVRQHFETLADEVLGPGVEGNPRWLDDEAAADLAREDIVPKDSFIEERWFDFSYLDRYQQVDRFWLNKPFAYATILYDQRAKSYRYHVTEPVLSSFEQYAREDLVRIVRNNLMYEEVEEGVTRETVFGMRVNEIISEHAKTVPTGTVHKLSYFLFRDFLDYGRIDPLMRDPRIEDISCDGAGVPVFVYHEEFRDLRTNVQFEGQQLNSLTVRLAQQAGKHISVSNPLVDASLPDGSRIQLTLGTEVSSRGSNFTIRKFSQDPKTPVDLIKWNTFNVHQMAFLWLAIANNRSLIFAGGTGSGKTTSMNAISFFIPPDSKVVSIEDTREITLPHDNWIQGVTRTSASADGKGEIGTYELLQASLRQRPEYILVGEIRTEPKVALTFFQAIGTGHSAYSTFHADSVASFLSRIRNAPLGVPAQMVQDLDIVCIQKQVFQGDQRVRRNMSIAELGPGETGEDVAINVTFTRDPRTDRYLYGDNSKVLEAIADQRGWTDAEVHADLRARVKVLRYLVDNGIENYREVGAVLHMFARDPEYVLDLVERDELDPIDLPLEIN